MTYEVERVRHSRVVLTNAQIKALPTTPVELVRAPGAGMMLWPMRAVVQLDRSGGAYTNLSTVDGTYLRIATPGAGQYGEAGHFWRATISGVYVAENTYDYLGVYLAGEGDGRLVSILSFLGPLDSSPSDLANRALQIEAANAAGNYTGGHTANTLRVDLWWRVLDLS